MTTLKTLLTEVLNNGVGAGAIVGIAAIGQRGGVVEAVWLPPSSDDEPAFLAYSITKTFIATLVLLLHEEGRLSLDDSLARWFPRITASERISLRQLLNHTAGIPDYGALRSYHDAVRASPATPWSFERFAAETFDKGLLFAPGASWAYSNPGFMLLKRITEDVTETTFADLITHRIARPLGLARTYVPESLAGLASLAPAVSHVLAPDGTRRDVRDHYHPGWVSHGVVAATPSDIVRFFAALFGGRLMSQASLAAMTTLVAVPLPSDASTSASAPPSVWRKPSYGLGLMADPASRWGRLWGHNGGGPGYRASAFHAPDLGGISVCAIGALEGDFEADRLVFAVLDRFVDMSRGHRPE